MMTNMMQPKRRAKETRAAARASLKSFYWLAVLACLIAAMLGATVAAGSSLSVDFSEEDAEVAANSIHETFAHVESWDEVEHELRTWWASIPWTMLAVVGAISLVTTIAYTWVGYCMRLGLCRFHMSLTDGEKPGIGMLFSYFGRAFWRSVGMNVLRNLILLLYQIPALLAASMGFYVFGKGMLSLWGTLEMTDEIVAYIVLLAGQFAALILIAMLLLLLTIPISLRYVMADYVLMENPEVGAVGALRESRRMMKGNKWRYFCLQLSFIGWHILAGLALGLGGIFLAPYVEQANTEFYDEVSGRASVREAVRGLGEFMQGL